MEGVCWELAVISSFMSLHIFLASSEACNPGREHGPGKLQAAWGIRDAAIPFRPEPRGELVLEERTLNRRK